MDLKPCEGIRVVAGAKGGKPCNVFDSTPLPIHPSEIPKNLECHPYLPLRREWGKIF